MVKLPRYLATKFHQWHNGMDAVYAVGSQISAGINLDLNSVISAKALLKVDLELGNVDNPKDLEELDLLISLCDAIILKDWEFLMIRDLAYYALVYLFANELEYVVEESENQKLLNLHHRWFSGQDILDTIPEFLFDCGVKDIEPYLPTEVTKELIEKLKIKYQLPLVKLTEWYVEEEYELYEKWRYILDEYDYKIDVSELVSKVQECWEVEDNE